jgi:hypothetical protein
MMEPFIFTSHLGKMKIIPAYLPSSSLAENEILASIGWKWHHYKGDTVKIQRVAVRGNYKNPSSDAKGEVAWTTPSISLLHLRGSKQILPMFAD